MAGLTIDITYALHALNRLTNHPLTTWMKTVAVREKTKVEERIRSVKKTPERQAWVPWTESTKKHRARKGTITRGLLYDEGLLLASLITHADDTHVVIGTPVEYAGYLQDGTPNMAARPYMGWDDVSLAKYEQEAARVLQGLV